MFEALLNGMDFLSVFLLVVGFILVGIEMTMPGISFPGIAGTVCLVVSIILIADTLVEGIMITLIILAILGILFGIILWLLSRGKLIRPIILQEEQHKDKGFLSSDDLDYLLGKEGVALTDLRPTGIGNFDGIRLDIRSEGGYITKDTPIIIDQVYGSRLIVKVKA